MSVGKGKQVDLKVVTWNIFFSCFCDKAGDAGEYAFAQSRRRFPMILGRIATLIGEQIDIFMLQEVCYYQLPQLRHLLADYHFLQKEYGSEARVVDGHADFLVLAIHKRLTADKPYVFESLENDCVLMCRINDYLTVATMHLPMNFEVRKTIAQRVADLALAPFLAGGDMNAIASDDNNGQTGLEPLLAHKDLQDATWNIESDQKEWRNKTFHGYPWDKFPGPSKLDYVFITRDLFTHPQARNRATPTVMNLSRPSPMLHESDHHPIMVKAALLSGPGCCRRCGAHHTDSHKCELCEDKGTPWD